MDKKYRGEFGSSPSLLDEAVTNPEIAQRLYDGIPSMSDRKSDSVRYVGDLAKEDGVIYMWNGVEWIANYDA